ncbi:CRTAC1 family protein [Alteromonas stellipolaris]|uniref:CRTAC1 family protein n=1 Tax=Alteromonas stellipolaris TaxID=233316 RepID=UPI000A943FA2|nr:CRTAC1 family protein [Alteromonas stellipolaris]
MLLSKKKPYYFYMACGGICMGLLAGCENMASNETSAYAASELQKSLDKPVILTNSQDFTLAYNVTGSALKRLNLSVEIDASYAQLTIMDGQRVVVDNLDIPAKGSHNLNVLVDFKTLGQHTLTFVRRSNDIAINTVNFEDVQNLKTPSFVDASQQYQLETEISYKYGGPAIGDIDADGDYDYVLNNHNHVPTQLVTYNGDNPVKLERLFDYPLDFHGSSVGDYDNDGDLDIMVAQGGANGTNPTSYILLNNDKQTFTNVSAQAGILTPARGRSPRWVDMDLDGDLDVALFNAPTPFSKNPVQYFFKNNGDSTFSQQRVKGLEDAAGERVLVTDFNHDGIDDFVMFSPITLWEGNGDFSYTDVTAAKLPPSLQGKMGYYAATDIDVNNDGLLDLYFAGSRTHYQISRKSIDFNPKTTRLDIRDDGETGSTAVSFTADDAIVLADLDLTYRQYNDGFAIFLGENKKRMVVNAKGFMPSQRPMEMRTAPSELTINNNDAVGWPEERKVNGLYIGYLGNNQWQAEWVRDRNIYWKVSFSLTGLQDIKYDWEPNNRNVQDLLLVNRSDFFVDRTSDWNIPLGGNHWGVTRGDFNNDGWQDLFLYRYGFLAERVADLMLLNNGKGRFENLMTHGASAITDTGHGDMGQAFDFNNDGQVDLLNGSEEEGAWYLYKNQSDTANNYILIDVNYSPKDNVDPYSALVSIKTGSGKTYQKRVGSAGEVHSQSLMDIVHFGLGGDTHITSATIRWRNGEEIELKNLTANKRYTTD